MMDFAPDYEKIFNNHLVVVTGIARSGTSLIEKVVGSFQDSFSLYEPVVFPSVLTLIEKKYLGYNEGKELLQAVL